MKMENYLMKHAKSAALQFIKKRQRGALMIKIKCESSNFLTLNEITDFQGDLKERSAGDMEKIKKSIKKHGVAFPIFIRQTEEKGKKINYKTTPDQKTRRKPLQGNKCQ